MGCASPFLTRRLFARAETWKVLCDFDTNQDKYISEFEKASNNDNDTLSVIQGTYLEKITKTDRPALKIRALGSRIPTPPISESGSGDESCNGDDGNKMKIQIDLWWKKTSIIGRILTFVYESKEVSGTELKNFIKECGSEDAISWYSDLVNKNKDFRLVFKRTDGTTSINEDAKKYIKTKM
jgi:hypothetical protein